MNRDIPGRSFFVAAYLILTIGFLTVHFTRVESFSAVVGPVTVKGRSSVGTTLSPPQIRRIRLNVNGLELGFRKNQRAFLITDDGIRHPLSVTDWNADDDSVRIVFSNDTAFEMTADPHGTGLRLIPSVPTTVPPVRSIELPFEPEGGTEMTVTADRPGTLEIRDGDREYIAELPADSRWDPGSRRLNLVVLDKADPILTIADDRRGAGLTAEEWIDQGNGPAGSAYERAVEDWIGVVRAGWESRIDPRSGLWTDASGNPRWSDELASALLADAVSAGSLPSRLQDVLSAADRSPTTIGWLPSPYLGNIVNQNRVHSQELRTTARSAAAALQDGTARPAGEGLLTALVDSGYDAEAAALTDLARREPEDGAAGTDVIDRIAVLHDAVELGLDDESDAAVRRALFDGWIVPRIFWV